MLTVRPAEQRGSTRLDWLDSKHSFSFGDYRDPAHRFLFTPASSENGLPSRLEAFGYSADA